MKNILVIGTVIPGIDADTFPLNTKVSLLDYDITIIDPHISDFFGVSDDMYMGKRCLDDSNSFQLKDHIAHWRREIIDALRAGRSVFLMLNYPKEVYVASGQVTYSGTGRSRVPTRHVGLMTNYELVPAGLDVTESSGSKMRLSDKQNWVDTYWSQLGDASKYRVTISGEGLKELVVTKAGGRIVGAYRRYKEATGALFFLPYIEFEDPGFTEERDGKTYWTDEAVALGNSFVSSLVDLDHAQRAASELTPAPEWVTDDQYRLGLETDIEKRLLALEGKLTKLQTQREEHLNDLADSRILKGLLYEKGKPLEHAVNVALMVLGFSSEGYSDENSEFDAVFQSKEGRCIGEVEGKNSRAISIDKLRQLETNVLEDFDRDEIEDIAKGVLIGNAHRLLPPIERGDFFTQKCITSAQRNQTALLRSVDLFTIAKYVSESGNEDFAKKCREVILNSVGIVSFPQIPEDDSSTS